MQKNEKWIVTVIGCILVGLTQHVSAVQVFFTGTGGDWADPANWSAPLTEGDYAVIRAHKSDAGPVVTIRSDVGTVNRAWIGDASGKYGPATLNIQDGAKINTLGSSEIPRIGQFNAIGFINISGGHYRSGKTMGSQYLKVGIDTAGKPATGALTISGGTIESKFIVGSTGVAGSTPDKLRIEGDKAKISSPVSASSGETLIVGQSGTLEFVFNSSGISSMTFKHSPVLFNRGSQIIIDGSAYTGGPKAFKLIDAVSLPDESATTVTLKNFKTPASYTWDKSNGDLTVTVSAP